MDVGERAGGRPKGRAGPHRALAPSPSGSRSALIPVLVLTANSHPVERARASATGSVSGVPSGRSGCRHQSRARWYRGRAARNSPMRDGWGWRDPQPPRVTMLWTMVKGSQSAACAMGAPTGLGVACGGQRQGTPDASAQGTFSGVGARRGASRQADGARLARSVRP